MNKHWIKWGLLTVLLGAVGSGAWEYIFKPIALGATGVLLNIATLGVRRFKDGLYAEVAQGHHEVASLKLLIMAICAKNGAKTPKFSVW